LDAFDIEAPPISTSSVSQRIAPNPVVSLPSTSAASLATHPGP